VDHFFDSGFTHPMKASRQIFSVLMILIGVAGLLIKHWLAGAAGELVHSYLGNFSVSFAVYFVISIGARPRLSRLTVALIALLVVEIFELTNGFGIMTNVYDPLDLLANALGILLAYCVDLACTRVLRGSRIQ
jgi:hypothetical protein